MNELRGVGKRGWLGLREFTQNRYPKLWAPFEKYFPDGLTNSRGERVTDLFEECCSRDIHGNPHHADWLEVPVREHVCRYMNLENPVWREYLKAIVRIHVDAGVDGIQFDEPDSPLTALRYGGDFSHDTMAGFRAFLAGLPPDDLPIELAGRLDGFDYGTWLRAQGREGVDPERPDALLHHYIAFLSDRVAANFAELSTYVREYAASVGRTVLVSSNLYDGAPWHDPLAAMVDILVPEQRHTLYEQPGWMRYIAGFGGDKPVCISTNPYGGVMPELLPKLNRGRAMDRYRVMMYEAAAMGVNMSVPYGAWMGAKIEDAVWAPHAETVENQDFLADHEHLFSRSTANELAVVASPGSSLVAQALDGALQARIDPTTGRRRQHTDRGVSFFSVAEELASAGHPLDVVVFHDGRRRHDDAAVGQLRRYRRVVLPDCTALTERQGRVLLDYLDLGGALTIFGEVGVPDDPVLAPRLRDHPGSRTVDTLDAALLSPERQLSLAGIDRASANLQRTATGVALHLIVYDFDESADRSRPALGVDVAVRLPFVAAAATMFRPTTTPVMLQLSEDRGRTRVSLTDVAGYAIVAFDG